MRAMETIGQRIKRLRKAKGLKPAAFARLVNVSQTTVGRWEAGQAVPSTASVHRICEVLGVSMEQLTQGEAARPRWPFDKVDEKAIAELDQRHLDMLQGAILAIAVQLGVDVSKR